MRPFERQGTEAKPTPISKTTPRAALPPPPLTKGESDLVLLRNRRVLLSAVIEDTLTLASVAARRK